MAKPLRILDDIVEYHLQHSRNTAIAIVEEYDRAMVRLQETPLIYRLRPHGWRAYLFRSGPYVLYYREMPAYWLAAGIFHGQRHPSWIEYQLLLRHHPLNTATVG